MSPRRRKQPEVELPKAVQKIKARAREYYYYQAGRGTKHEGPRIKLPNDPQSPEFWQAVRQAQGLVGPTTTDTINALAVVSYCRRQARHSQQHAGRAPRYVPMGHGSA